MLSPGERRRLDEIEQALHAEDPQLAAMFPIGGSPSAWRWLYFVSLGTLILTALLFIYLGAVWLCLLTAAMAVGLWLARRRRRAAR